MSRIHFDQRLSRRVGVRPGDLTVPARRRGRCISPRRAVRNDERFNAPIVELAEQLARSRRRLAAIAR